MKGSDRTNSSSGSMWGHWHRVAAERLSVCCAAGRQASAAAWHTHSMPRTGVRSVPACKQSPPCCFAARFGPMPCVHMVAMACTHHHGGHVAVTTSAKLPLPELERHQGQHLRPGMMIMRGMRARRCGGCGSCLPAWLGSGQQGRRAQRPRLTPDACTRYCERLRHVGCAPTRSVSQGVVRKL